MSATADDCIHELAVGLSSFYGGGRVPRVDARTLDPVTFLRDYVSQSRPVVLQHAIDDWKALDLWQSDEYLRKRVGDRRVRVNVTPDGLGDALKVLPGRSPVVGFVKPYEAQLPFSEFWDGLYDEDMDASDDNSLSGKLLVPYLSHQNDSLREEFPMLQEDIAEFRHCRIGQLGLQSFDDLDAINLWIGDGRAVSSCHKDFYENLYCVVRGTKIFHLLPPAAVPFLEEKNFLEAVYVRANPAEEFTLHSRLRIQLCDANNRIPWITVDPSSPDPSQPGFQTVSNCTMVAEVRAGECLYLPALYYHRVSQKSITVSVNAWYDMTFDHRYVYYNAVRKLAGLPT